MDVGFNASLLTKYFGCVATEHPCFVHSTRLSTMTDAIFVYTYKKVATPVIAQEVIKTISGGVEKIPLDGDDDNDGGGGVQA